MLQRQLQFTIVSISMQSYSTTTSNNLSYLATILKNGKIKCLCLEIIVFEKHNLRTF